VTVITYRQDRDEAVALLEAIGIRHDDLITSADARYPLLPGEPLDEWKARTVMGLGADVFFEDMPEVIHRIEPPVKVFFTCDEVMRDWIRGALAARDRSGGPAH
jgi:hypothetical protein